MYFQSFFRALNSSLSPSTLHEEGSGDVSEELDLVGSIGGTEPSTPLDLNDTEVEKIHFLGGKCPIPESCPDKHFYVTRFSSMYTVESVSLSFNSKQT